MTTELTLEQAEKAVMDRQNAINNLRNQIEQEEQELAIAKDRLREMYRRKMEVLGLEEAPREEVAPIDIPPKEFRGKKDRKPRAERWKIQRFLRFVRDAHPSSEQLEAKRQELDVSAATVYKYTWVDSAGHTWLRKEGEAAME